MFRSTKPFKDQKYSSLKDQCVSSGKLFQDPEFPPESRSLYYSQKAPPDIVWKRPKDITDNPQLFVGGASVDDFAQGELGNCWFVSACTSIARSKLWKKIVPDCEGQEWTAKNKYAGIFHFHFFRFGEWVDVVIDDYLPTRRGRLIFAQSKTPNEYWSALLEKAYAKLFGDYESLKGGHAEDALVDLTGGVAESFELEPVVADVEKREWLFRKLEKALETHSEMTASIHIKDNYDTEKKLAHGLIATHAYSVTAIKDIRFGKGLVAFFKRDKIKMIRCRNPWGEAEWTGAWSDGSKEWEKITKAQKKEMGLVFDDNGEFWMSFEDFCKEFTDMGICHLLNTSLFTFHKTWRESVCGGRWKSPGLAGGCANNKATHLKNPQYVFDVTSDEDKVMLSLEQEDARVAKDKGKKNASIGLPIYKADLNRKYRMHDKYEEIESKLVYSQRRSAFARLQLTRGRYLVVPSTFEPGHQGRFMLRAYGAKDLDLRELTKEMPTKTKWSGGAKYHQATQITIYKATDLEKQDKSGANPYCVVKCESKSVRTPTRYGTLSPEWNWRIALYQTKKKADITIEVYHENTLRDQFLGKATIEGSSEDYNKQSVLGLHLMGEGRHAADPTKGGLYVKLKHFDNIAEA